MIESQENKTTLTVSQALALAKRSLESIDVAVIGEISEFSNKAGYKAIYFTITDKQGALSCLMWRSEYAKDPIELRQGLLVQVSGRFSVYAAKGRMNFVARSIKPAGEGDLRMKVAMLARKLQTEGLMAPARKRALVKYPERVAVVTSPRGKAVHDVLRTLRRRSPQVEVYVVGVAVEGINAPADICKGLEMADASRCDAILLVRGGGSYEDLMPFNDESVARTIGACSSPVVTGIGHEPDNSIADMVSDLRCSTPTAAAEAVAMDIVRLSANLDEEARRMASALSTRVHVEHMHIDQLASRPIFSDPTLLLSPMALQLDMDAERLARAIPNAIADEAKLLENMQGSLESIATRLVDCHRSALALTAARLSDLSPLSILARGYAITYDKDEQIIKSISQVSCDDQLGIRVNDGKLKCRVTGIKPDDDEEEESDGREDC